MPWHEDTGGGGKVPRILNRRHLKAVNGQQHVFVIIFTKDLRSTYWRMIRPRISLETVMETETPYRVRYRL